MTRILLFLPAVLVIVNACAQKLPPTQQVGVRAPDSVKIDGKPAEWGQTLSAYNPATEIEYTIANDVQDLYIVATVKGQDMGSRILSGGLSFVVANKSKDNDRLVFTFPTYDTPNHKADYYITIPWAGLAESSMQASNNIIKNKARYIRTAGVIGVDSLLSIYNNFDIKAAGNFNIKHDLTLEMAIPLKYLKGYIQSDKFNYTMIVNGMKLAVATSTTFFCQTGAKVQKRKLKKPTLMLTNIL